MNAAEDSSGHFVLLLEDLAIQREFQVAEEVEEALQQIARVGRLTSSDSCYLGRSVFRRKH